MIREIIDQRIQDRIVGWPGDLATRQAGGWSIPQYSADLNATAAVYEAMAERGQSVNQRFLHLIQPGISSPMAVCIAALQIDGSSK